MSSSLNAISSNLIKKAIFSPYYALPSVIVRPLQTFNSLSFKKISTLVQGNTNCVHASRMMGDVPNELPPKSPLEIPAATPLDKPDIPPEVTRMRANGPDFDPIPLEQPADTPPISPVPNPEFPVPPNQSPPKPEGPKPPIPLPPYRPEVFPPHGPDVIPPKPPESGEVIPPGSPELEPPNGPEFIPPKPPEPGFPHPILPDIPPIVM